MVRACSGNCPGRAPSAPRSPRACREHPDWDEYYRAMMDERRLLLTLTVTYGYGGRAG